MSDPKESLNDILGASGGFGSDEYAPETLAAPVVEERQPPRPYREVPTRPLPVSAEAPGRYPSPIVDPPRRETAEEAAMRIRAQRRAGEKDHGLNGFSKRLDVFGDVPGFTLKIIDDDGDRLDRAQRHGYAFVHSDEIRTNGNVTSFNTDMGSRVRFVLGKKRDSDDVLYGFLMKIPNEIHHEDMLAHEAVNRRVDDGIRQGRAPGESKEDLEGRYIPGGRVSYDPGQAKTYRQTKE